MKPLYAIRHKPSGFYLPQPTGYSGRGGSHVEPVDCSDDKQNPRLFQSRIAARNALSQWIRGKQYKETSTEGSYEEGYYEVDDYPSVVHQPHRKKEEMEIVEFHLVINLN